MAPRSKIVDEQEVRAWFAEGRSYGWMSEEYLRKYNIEMSASGWSYFRRQQGLARRTVRDDNLIPWFVKPEHRYHYLLILLRTEARRRVGKKLDRDDQYRLDALKRNLIESGLVVQYDPESDTGFSLVLRREGIDRDMIREPERKTTLRPPAD